MLSVDRNLLKDWRVGLLLLAASLGLGGVSLGGCTEARLQKEAPQLLEAPDDKLQIKGRFCSEPSGRVSFPVKVLFVLDQSSSLQCTDSGQKRFGALRRTIDDLRANPNTQFAFIGFSSWSRKVNFTRNREDVAEFLDPNQGLGPATDYQGALSTALRLVEADMLEVGPAERARTRYQVVFVSDGVPEPRCNAGCEDDIRTCTDGIDNDGDGLIDEDDPHCADIDDNSLHPDNLYPVCNTTQEIPEDVYVDMDGICPAYNQPNQIRRRIEELVNLKGTYSAGGVVLNTVLLFSPQEVVEQICPGAAADFGYEKTQAEGLLREMARDGGGTFRDVNVAREDDDFLRFDVTSLKADQVLTSIMATNENAARGRDGFEVDSDGDGLSDARERELNTDPFKRDTDGDGFSDLFEEIFRSEGFSPDDAARPSISCEDRDDRDGDGLNGCEEAYLGTNPLLADTDGDGVIDWVELLNGTDPLVADADEDLDFDGISNADEIFGGTDPTVDDRVAYRDSRIVYGLEDLGVMEVAHPRSTPENPRTQERHCYDFNVRRVPLMVTKMTKNHGRNRILIYTNERPARVGGSANETRVACFEAIYDGAHLKSPASGVIDVSQEGIDGISERLSAIFDPLATCGYFAPDAPLERDDLVDMVNACMPSKIAVENRLYPRRELIELVESTVGGDLSPKLPKNAYELFVPSQTFRPGRDCHRPWEFELLERFAEQMEESCRACAGVGDTDENTSDEAAEQ